MKQNIRTGFDTAVNEFEARERHHQEAEKIRQHRRAIHLAAVREQWDAQLIAALTEISEMLQAKDWTCQLVDEAAGFKCRLEMFRGEMRCIDGNARPYVSFELDDERDVVVVTGGSIGQHGLVTTIKVSELDAESIQLAVLTVFQRIASGM